MRRVMVLSDDCLPETMIPAARKGRNAVSVTCKKVEQQSVATNADAGYKL